jgi:hypothetical protein
MSVIFRKVQHGVAKDDIRKIIRERHLLDPADLEVFRRQTGFKRSRKLPHMVDSGRVLVDGKDFASLPQKVHEVPSIAAAGVQNSHLAGDRSPQNLVENVNIDQAELLLNAHRQGITPALHSSVRNAWNKAFSAELYRGPQIEASVEACGGAICQL